MYHRSHFGNSVPVLNQPVSILQNAQYSAVKDHLAKANIHVIRNLLSVLLSAYYSHRITHPCDDWPRLAHQRQLLQYCDAKEGMLLTLAFLKPIEFAPHTPGPFACIGAWDYNDDRITTVRMEDAVLDPHAFLTQFIALSGMENFVLPDTDEFLFERFTGRQVGQVNETSHYRSGNPDAWRTELPEFIVDYVREEFRPFLERFYPEALSDTMHS